MFTKFSTTGIGSMPHTDAGSACDLILGSVDIPFWPQLPKRSFRELMIPQYSEGMPGVRLDDSGSKIWVDQGSSDEINEFYDTYSDSTLLPISEGYAEGFKVFTGKIAGNRFPAIKGHITGPLTYTLGLKDEEGRPVYFNEELREIAIMVLVSKARWQIEELGSFCDKVMIFIDEPILSALGTSSYVGVSNEEAQRLLSETVKGIKEAGGVSAIHCCGKADWQMVEESGIDVVNFDAYDYFDNFSIYTDPLSDFLDRGGRIAWGIVPTNDAIGDASLDVLADTLREQFGQLSKRLGREDLASRVILTPSCGAGSLTVVESEKVFGLLRELKQEILGG